MVKARKQKILDSNNLLTALGRPINNKRFTFGLGQNPFGGGAKAATVEEEVGDSSVEGVKELAKQTNSSKSTQRLRVFLCHSSEDKLQVRDIYKRLIAEGIEAWLDEESLLPGQDWELEISRAIRSTHVVIVCLSQNSTTKRVMFKKKSSLPWMKLINSQKGLFSLSLSR